MQERFHPRNAKSLLLRFHVQTAGSTLTAQQPENNIVRTALQALAAVLGGAQSLHTNSFDEALGLPTEKAATIALRTQQVIAHESGVPSTIDPVGGAYFLEALTDDLEAKAREYLAEIDRRGGMLAAIETGFVQHEIHVAAYQYQQEVEAGRAVVVGVNKFIEDEPEPPKIFQPDVRVEAERAERLRAFRAGRDAAVHERAMANLERGARGDENLVALILQAVKARATLGEISDRLRLVFGVFQPAKTL